MLGRLATRAPRFTPGAPLGRPDWGLVRPIGPGGFGESNEKGQAYLFAVDHWLNTPAFPAVSSVSRSVVGAG